MRRIGLARLAVVLLLLLTSSSGADDVAKPGDAAKPDDASGIEFFESKIRPVLAHQCYACHSTAAGKSESGLLLDSRERMRAGGDRGPAVVPRDAKASLLLAAIAHADADLKMPPKKDRLPEAVIADFRKWIEMGAPDPREGGAASVVRAAIELETARRFWSLQKPVLHSRPRTENASWAKHELDHFILAKLAAAKLKPSDDSEPGTFLRRLHFDLVGLPPAPESLEEFFSRIKEVGIEAAIEFEVDRLLVSKHFGERWGRH